MRLAKILSLLLQYPTRDLVEARAELVRAAEAPPRPPEARLVLRFLEEWEGRPLEELQRDYVETFDFDARASLHLTYHLYGDRRRRGIELIRLKRRLAEAGLEETTAELPDYLPVLLEVAALDPPTGEAVLAELRAPIELVRSRLGERGSPYRLLLDAVVSQLPRLTPDQVERMRALEAEGPPTELVGLEPAGAVRGGGEI